MWSCGLLCKYIKPSPKIPGKFARQSAWRIRRPSSELFREPSNQQPLKVPRVVDHPQNTFDHMMILRQDHLPRYYLYLYNATALATLCSPLPRNDPSPWLFSILPRDSHQVQVVTTRSIILSSNLRIPADVLKCGSSPNRGSGVWMVDGWDVLIPEDYPKWKFQPLSHQWSCHDPQAQEAGTT